MTLLLTPRVTLQEHSHRVIYLTEWKCRTQQRHVESQKTKATGAGTSPDGTALWRLWAAAPGTQEESSRSHGSDLSFQRLHGGPVGTN